MFWNVTLRRLGGAPATRFPKTFDGRPDLESGQRMLAVATEAGILVTMAGPPPARTAEDAESPPVPRFRSTVRAPGR